MATPLEFAVVDVETTGVLPERYDRIIEIAVIRARENGDVIDEYCTLVNPNRDVGSTRIHGITAGDLQKAPTFAEIAGDVISRMDRAVFVAHNANFDWRFVQHECAQVGIDLPKYPIVCTMQSARRADPNLPGRSLDCVCEHFGISLTQHHSAHADAMAALGILRSCLPSMQELQVLRHNLLHVTNWPDVPPSGKHYLRTHAKDDASCQRSFLAELIAHLPAASFETPEVHDYLALLDRVLEDRRVTEDEFESMLDRARELGLIQEQVRCAHEAYMHDLVTIALADRVLSKAESDDLEAVRRLLAIDQTAYQHMLQHPKHPVAAPARATSGSDLEGKTICFTGELQCTICGDAIERSKAEEAACGHGMVIKSGVSKKLDFLVVAEPDSMSGKAKKARDYSVRIVAEPVFWQMVGVAVD